MPDRYEDLERRTCDECDVPFLGLASENMCGACCDFYTEAQLRDEGVIP
jgi:hypothetical protein